MDVQFGSTSSEGYKQDWKYSKMCSQICQKWLFLEHKCYWSYKWSSMAESSTKENWLQSMHDVQNNS